MSLPSVERKDKCSQVHVKSGGTVPGMERYARPGMKLGSVYSCIITYLLSVNAHETDHNHFREQKEGKVDNIKGSGEQ